MYHIYDLINSTYISIFIVSRVWFISIYLAKEGHRHYWNGMGRIIVNKKQKLGRMLKLARITHWEAFQVSHRRRDMDSWGGDTGFHGRRHRGHRRRTQIPGEQLQDSIEGDTEDTEGETQQTRIPGEQLQDSMEGDTGYWGGVTVSRRRRNTGSYRRRNKEANTRA